MAFIMENVVDNGWGRCACGLRMEKNFFIF